MWHRSRVEVDATLDATLDAALGNVASFKGWSRRHARRHARRHIRECGIVQGLMPRSWLTPQVTEVAGKSGIVARRHIPG